MRRPIVLSSSAAGRIRLLSLGSSLSVERIQRNLTWEDKMMRKGSLLSLVAIAAATMAVGSVLTTQAEAQKRVKWKMQSTFGSTLTHLGPSGVRFVKDIKRMSGGNFEIKFFEPNALVPSLECFDVVSKGSIESCWTTPGYHTGKIPALAFYPAVPVGPQLGEFVAW